MHVWQIGLFEIKSSKYPLLHGHEFVVKFLVAGQVRQYVLDCEHVRQVYEHFWHYC